MKKFLLMILFSFAFAACSSQSVNKIITDEPTGKKILVGYINREVFSDTLFSAWYHKEYDNYKPDASMLKRISENPLTFNIKVVMGSWCSDTKRELPRFLRILDELRFPAENLSMIAVDVDKRTEGKELEGLNIEFVPTFIFYRGPQEIGRIVEMPKTTLEKDFYDIVNRKE